MCHRDYFSISNDNCQKCLSSQVMISIFEIVCYGIDERDERRGDYQQRFLDSS